MYRLQETEQIEMKKLEQKYLRAKELADLEDTINIGLKTQTNTCNKTIKNLRKKIEKRTRKILAKRGVAPLQFSPEELHKKQTTDKFCVENKVIKESVKFIRRRSQFKNNSSGFKSSKCIERCPLKISVSIDQL
jgi:hypothetical protein